LVKSSKKAEGYGPSRFMRYGYDLGMSTGANPELRVKVEDIIPKCYRISCLFLEFI